MPASRQTIERARLMLDAAFTDLAKAMAKEHPTTPPNVIDWGIARRVAILNNIPLLELLEVAATARALHIRPDSPRARNQLALALAAYDKATGQTPSKNSGEPGQPGINPP